MERKITFLNTFAGMLPVAAILIVCLSGGSVLSNFYTQANAQATWMQFVWMALIACAIAVSVRAKGPDFSVLSVMGLCMWIVGVCTVQGYGIVAGLIAALLAGVLLFSRLVVVVPPAAFSFGNILFLLFVTAGIYASRAFDNGIFPVLYALALAAVWVLLGIVMNLFSIASFPQIFVQLLLAAGMVVLAYFTSEWKKRKNL